MSGRRMTKAQAERGEFSCRKLVVALFRGRHALTTPQEQVAEIAEAAKEVRAFLVRLDRHLAAKKPAAKPKNREGRK